MRTSVALALWLCGGVFASAAAPANAASELFNEWAPYIRIDTIGAQSGDAWLHAAGKIGYDEERTQQLRSPVNGRITRVYAKLGDRVRAGDPLFGLASAEAAQLRAELQKDREDLLVLARGRERARSLHHDGAVSPKDLAEAEAAYNKGVAERARDEAHVAALGLDLTHPGAEAAVVARMAGIVTARDAAVGMEVRADDAQPLAVVSNLDQVWLWINVFERDLASVQVGAAVEANVAAWPGTVFAGRVDYIGDVVDVDARAVRVRCTLDNKARALKPQMFVSARISLPKQGSLLVASDAVVLRGDKSYVVVVDADESLHLREVELGAIVSGRQAVHRGLKVGEKVIGKGAVLVAQRLRQDQ